MAPYDDWNRIDEDDEDELQDISWLEGKRDVILFCIDCSESMLELRNDSIYEDTKTCHLYSALEAAMQIQKRKVLVGPNDSVGILLFNTSRRNESTSQGSEIKRNNFVYQPIEQISAPKVLELMQLLDAARDDPEFLRTEFPPLSGNKRVPMGDVFTSCNWVLRDGAPKTATKRVFLITDEDDPHPGAGGQRLITSSQTTLLDLTQAGVTVEPFFISTEEKPFDTSKFYSSILLPTNLEDTDASLLPESIFITRIEDLIAQMRIYEVPKRSIFNVPFQLADGFVIGVKGYGLVTEQKKGSYKYFVDLGDKMGVAGSKTIYADIDDDAIVEVPKDEILYGMTLGATTEHYEKGGRVVPVGSRVFYTAEEVKSFRSMGLEPGIKLLGFKDRTELRFEDNVKHSTFIYPDEMTYSGSKRTFGALLRSMLAKAKIGLALALTRRNAPPVFCALLPQEEKPDETGWLEPSGFHLVPLPYADDIRAAPIDEGSRASGEIVEAARAWVLKLAVKNGAYPPDAYPNSCMKMEPGD
ncbi:SPOC domain-like protein [Neolentinus lepideus HHB14362 ss-1]|uniref:DNA helicase n=1 Tax=Neolentinus lepideus HHB14362 ss-1 TaxID=1314782 RepID=A0A165TVA9_9AGAM|nr:SPOC domain-like protein [Neolentinus lepideus HHB14362 ss-1]